MDRPLRCQPYFWTKIALATYVMVIWISGTVLHLFLISYEWDSGDPQKRGINNQVRLSLDTTAMIAIFELQLTSLFSLHTIFAYACCMPQTAWRILVGPWKSEVKDFDLKMFQTFQPFSIRYTLVPPLSS